jgi:hypothetical protein
MSIRYPLNSNCVGCSADPNQQIDYLTDFVLTATEVEQDDIWKIAGMDIRGSL